MSELTLREKIYCNWYLFKSDLSKDKELIYFFKAFRFSIIFSLFYLILNMILTIILLI